VLIFLRKSKLNLLEDLGVDGRIVLRWALKVRVRGFRLDLYGLCTGI
jgi:hypothetical protein